MKLPQLWTLKRDRVPLCEEHAKGMYSQCLVCVCRRQSRALALIDDAIDIPHPPDANWVTPYDLDFDEEGVVKRVKDAVEWGILSKYGLPHRPRELLEELNKCHLTGDDEAVYVRITPRTYMRLIDILKSLT